jgi:hypothetical protein
VKKEVKITRKREIFEERSSFFFGSCAKQVPFCNRSLDLHFEHKINRGKKFYSIEKKRKLTKDLIFVSLLSMTPAVSWTFIHKKSMESLGVSVPSSAFSRSVKQKGASWPGAARGDNTVTILISVQSN